MFSCLMERLKTPTTREHEIARLTAYMVVGSFTKVGSISNFYGFSWDGKNQGSSLNTQEDIEAMIERVDNKLERRNH